MGHKKTNVSLFSDPSEFNDEWICNHGPHGLIKVKHTVFLGKDGIEYMEYRCYRCKKVARQVLSTVSTSPQKKPEKEKRGIHNSRQNFEHYAVVPQWSNGLVL